MKDRQTDRQAARPPRLTQTQTDRHRQTLTHSLNFPSRIPLLLVK